jgi:hypothetical protein
MGKASILMVKMKNDEPLREKANLN